MWLLAWACGKRGIEYWSAHLPQGIEYLEYTHRNMHYTIHSLEIQQSGAITFNDIAVSLRHSNRYWTAQLSGGTGPRISSGLAGTCVV